MAIGVFGTVGWIAVEPYDPLGAVSLATRSGVLGMMVSVWALSAVVAGLATALLGRKLPDAGSFAVAVGLAVMNLRGANAQYLLMDLAGTDPAAQDALAWRLAFEGFFWFSAILVAMLASAAVLHWVLNEADAQEGETGWLAWTEAHLLLPFLEPTRRSEQDRSWLAGIKVTSLTLLGGALLFRLLVTGSPWRSIQHGQSYFALFAAFYLASAVAYRYWRVRSVLWGCLAPPLLCLMGYIIAASSSPPRPPYDELASVPPSAFFRATPLDYVAVGTVADRKSVV